MDKLLTKNLFFSFVLFPIAVTGAGLEKYRSSPDEVKLSNFSVIEKKHIGHLRLWTGPQYEHLEKKIKQKYPGFMVVDTCQATLHEAGTRDFAIALIGQTQNRAVYLGVISEGKGVFTLADLYSFPIEFSAEGFVIGRGVEVMCPSWTELARIASDYSSAATHSGSGSTLKLRNRFDAVCGSPTDGDNEFICFQYDSANRKFLPIGGWHNE